MKRCSALRDLSNEHHHGLVLANRANADGVVESILGSSHVVIVSGESSSMIAEAVASGRPVIVIQPESQPSRSVDAKRRALLSALAAVGRVTVVPSDGIAAAIESAAVRPETAGASDWDALCTALNGF